MFSLSYLIASFDFIYICLFLFFLFFRTEIHLFDPETHPNDASTDGNRKVDDGWEVVARVDESAKDQGVDLTLSSSSTHHKYIKLQQPQDLQSHRTSGSINITSAVDKGHHTKVVANKDGAATMVVDSGGMMRGPGREFLRSISSVTTSPVSHLPGGSSASSSGGHGDGEKLTSGGGSLPKLSKKELKLAQNQLNKLTQINIHLHGKETRRGKENFSFRQQKLIFVCINYARPAIRFSFLSILQPFSRRSNTVIWRRRARY